MLQLLEDYSRLPSAPKFVIFALAVVVAHFLSSAVTWAVFKLVGRK